MHREAGFVLVLPVGKKRDRSNILPQNKKTPFAELRSVITTTMLRRSWIKQCFDIILFR